MNPCARSVRRRASSRLSGTAEVPEIGLGAVRLVVAFGT